MRKDYYEDYRETKTDELEDCSKSIDKRIRNLKKMAKDVNDDDKSDIESAIAELKEEQKM